MNEDKNGECGRKTVQMKRALNKKCKTPIFNSWAKNKERGKRLRRNVKDVR